MIEKILYLCEQKNISVHKLEQDLGFSNGSLKKAKNIPAERIRKIAAYFHIQAEDLLDGTPPDEWKSTNQFEQLKAYAENLKTDGSSRIAEDNDPLWQSTMERLSDLFLHCLDPYSLMHIEICLVDASITRHCINNNVSRSQLELALDIPRRSLSFSNTISIRDLYKIAGYFGIEPFDMIDNNQLPEEYRNDPAEYIAKTCHSYLEALLIECGALNKTGIQRVIEYTCDMERINEYRWVPDR